MKRNDHIKWRDLEIEKNDRELRNGHKAALIWLTGLPCAGKSTLANEIQSILFHLGCQVYVMDGDNIRHGLNKDLGFTPDERAENLRRVGEVAKLFVDAGVLVIAAFISPMSHTRKHIRSMFDPGEYIEIYLEADVNVCEKRDVKGMYAKAKRGEIQDFTGISAPYERPINPELVIPTSELTVEESTDKIMEYIRELSFFNVV